VKTGGRAPIVGCGRAPIGDRAIGGANDIGGTPGGAPGGAPGGIPDGAPGVPCIIDIAMASRIGLLVNGMLLPHGWVDGSLRRLPFAEELLALLEIGALLDVGTTLLGVDLFLLGSLSVEHHFLIAFCNLLIVLSGI